MLASGVLIVLSFWNHNNFDYALVTRFFKLKSVENQTTSRKKAYDHTQPEKYTEFVPTKFCNFCEYIFESLPFERCKKCCPCKRDRKYIGMQKAR